MKKKANPEYSRNLSEFIKMMTDAQADYEWNKDEVNRLDKLTQDYLHILELKEYDYKKRAKVATQLSLCRQLRRESKDTTELLEPLIQFLYSDKGKSMMSLLRQALGKTRQVETKMQNRIYRYRIFEGSSEILQNEETA